MDEPEPLYLPASHSSHDVMPDDAANVPVLHAVQLVFPVKFMCVPVAQSSHAARPGAGWYLPLAHLSHAVKPVPFDTLPAVQSVQLEALVLLYVPLLQFEQGD